MNKISQNQENSSILSIFLLNVEKCDFNLTKVKSKQIRCGWKVNQTIFFFLRSFKRFQNTNPNSRKFERDRETETEKERVLSKKCIGNYHLTLVIPKMRLANFVLNILYNQ